MIIPVPVTLEGNGIRLEPLFGRNQIDCIRLNIL